MALLLGVPALQTPIMDTLLDCIDTHLAKTQKGTWLCWGGWAAGSLVDVTLTYAGKAIVEEFMRDVLKHPPSPIA